MKILKISGIVIIALLLLLLSIPFLFKGKLLKRIQTEVNNQVNATVSFSEDIDLGLISSFPNLSLGIKDILVINKAPFAGDTLLAVKEFSAVLDIMSVLRNEPIQIRKIGLKNPLIYALVNEQGRANWDITLPDTNHLSSADTSSSAYALKLRQLIIENARIHYIDKSAKMEAHILGMQYELSGDFSEVMMEMKSKLKMEQLTVEMEGVRYLNKVNASMEGTLLADLAKMKFDFKDHQFNINALSLGLDGCVAMPTDDIAMDLKWHAQKNDLAQFLSLIPAVYASDMKDLQTKGKLALDGFIKGTYNEKLMPAFGLKVLIEEGWFKYAALPAPLENLYMNLNIENPDGEPDHTKINLEKLQWLLQGDAFEARLLTLTPISDPYIDAFFKGTINLSNMEKLVPLPSGTKLSGKLQSNVKAKGYLSTLEKGLYEAFDASGNLQVNDLVYEASDLPKALHVSTASMDFSPKVVTLQTFDAQIGKSDMHVKGQLENFYSYYLGGAVLKGNLQFASKLLDANEWLSEEATTTEAPDTSSMAIVEVPDNIDFTMNSTIDKLLYTNLDISQFKGMVSIANRQIDFKQIGLNLLGSSMKMDGYYETKDRLEPKVKLDFNMSDLDIQQAFKAFNSVQKLAPVGEHMQGKFSTQFKMYTSLTEHMQPVYETLLAEGLLMIPQATISNVESLKKVADFIAKPEYKQMTINQAKVAWKVINGKVYTQPFDVKLGKQNLRLGGTTSLEKEIDYVGTMNVPRKDLGEANKAVDEALGKLNALGETQIKMDEQLPLVFNIGGTFDKPTLKTNLKELLASQAGSLKDQAVDEAKKKAKELEAKARAEAEKQMNEAKEKAQAEALRVKAEAEAKLNAEKERIRQEAEAKKKEAEAKAKAEADKLKKQAEEEAKKKLKGLLNP